MMPIPLQLLQVLEDSDQARGEKNASATSIIIYYIAYLERAEFIFLESEGSFQT